MSLVFSVGRVAGFYSDWSPSISTSEIKVLASAHDEQHIRVPAGSEIDLPRLGQVVEAHLDIRTFRDLRQMKSDGVDGKEPGENWAAPAPPVLAPSRTDERRDKLLSQLRLAAWTIVGLLALQILF